MVHSGMCLRDMELQHELQFSTRATLMLLSAWPGQEVPTIGRQYLGDDDSIPLTPGGPVHPMHPAHSMQMGMPGPGHFGMPPFRPPGVPMGPPAARPPGADLDALLSKQTVQGRARTER